MSRFLNDRLKGLAPYVPGEQPKDMQYIKLNTNESPYPPAKEVLDSVSGEVSRLRLYSDPDCTNIVNKIAEFYDVKPECVIAVNGSDEALNFVFIAYGNQTKPIVFPDITYGFYPVFAKLNNVLYEEIPLKADFSIDCRDYVSINKNIVIANPNAPTGILLPLFEIEKIVESNPNNVVIIDEAYIDFGGESAINLTKNYDNLLVVQTFSKSRSMAGARLGFAIGNKKLISDLNTVRFSINPYNVNSMTMSAGCAALQNVEYFKENCKKIQAVRIITVEQLKILGFEVLPSTANFIFARCDKISGERLYSELKKRGILVRWFNKPKISDYNRITIGTFEQMQAFITTLKQILEEI